MSKLANVVLMALGIAAGIWCATLIAPSPNQGEFYLHCDKKGVLGPFTNAYRTNRVMHFGNRETKRSEYYAIQPGESCVVKDHS